MPETAKKTVLVVDDAPANIRIVNEILHDSYRVRIATNGEKGLELAAGTPGPDLILLDVVMPGMDGYQVCRELKSNPATRDIPVIFLTGQTESTDETRGFEVGAVDYIHKPFSPAVVAARVHTHLALRETREQLAAQLAEIHRELERARQIQLSILPQQPPSCPRLDLAARYFPMASVAGDFYDFIRIDENRLGVLVADVSGHGISAALVASMLKVALAAQESKAADPPEVLSGLNRALCGKFQGHYVTAAYVLVDIAKQTLTYSGAGHPPLVLRRHQKGAAETVLENGLFLGYFPQASYTAVELPFEPGDWAVLYSDGVTEMTNGTEEQFGPERLEAALNEFSQADGNGGASSSRFADYLLSSMTAWSGRATAEDPDDDVTLVAVHFQARDLAQ